MEMGITFLDSLIFSYICDKGRGGGDRTITLLFFCLSPVLKTFSLQESGHRLYYLY